MKVEVSAFDEKYKVSNVKVRLNNNKWVITWNFADADGFVIIAYPYDKENFNFLEFIKTNVIDLDNIVVNKNLGDIALKIISRANYMGGIEFRDSNFFNKPMRVEVFPYKKYDDVFKIYEQKEDDFSIIPYDINYRTSNYGGKLLSRVRKLMQNSGKSFRIDDFDSFFDGILYYTVGARGRKYPVTKNMLGKDIRIQAKDQDMISLKVDDRYKGYFKCRIKTTTR